MLVNFSLPRLIRNVSILSLTWAALAQTGTAQSIDGNQKSQGERRQQSSLTEGRAQSSVPSGTRVFKGLAYVPDGHDRQKLDLYLPGSGSGFPLIVWIHGGAWRAGSKNRCRARFFVEEGYAVASVNYRLSQHAVFPAQIEDCKAAIRWLRGNSKTYGINGDRIGVWGSSAGGHLVALLGTSGDVTDFESGGDLSVSSRVQAVCDWFGPTDFLRMNDFDGQIDHNASDSPESQLVGGSIQENQERVAQANPITYVSEDDPPFLIMHGDQDRLVPIHQSELLYETLTKIGVEAAFHRVKGAGHGFGGPANQQLVRAFFSRHLEN